MTVILQLRGPFCSFASERQIFFIETLMTFTAKGMVGQIDLKTSFLESLRNSGWKYNELNGLRSCGTDMQLNTIGI